MKRAIDAKAVAIVFLLVATLATPTFASHKKAKSKSTETTREDIAAIEYLGTVDCVWYPESQQVLMQSLESDPREPVRYAAVMALLAQLERQSGPWDPRFGWRKVPDPEILTQIVRVASLQKPLTYDELMDRYAERQKECLEKRRDKDGRKDSCRGCCSDELMQLLAKTAFDRDETGCYVEPAARVRYFAEKGLLLCCDAEQKQPSTDMSPTESTDGVASSTTDSPIIPEDLPESRRIYVPYKNPPPVGRADTANRLNILDNIGAEPRSRFIVGYQYIAGQETSLTSSGTSQALFNATLERARNVTSPAAEGYLNSFISATGIGRYDKSPVIDPANPPIKPGTTPERPYTLSELADLLESRYNEFNSDRGSSFQTAPNTHLLRLGIEYAITPDFSLMAMAQFVDPGLVSEAETETSQEEAWSNPMIMLKHVLYRDEKTVFSTGLAVLPQITAPRFSLVEDTTRINPGIFLYRSLNEKWSFQGALGGSVPVDSDQIHTIDYGLTLSHWLFKHESLEPWSQGESTKKWFLGLMPSVEVYGKHVIGNNVRRGAFGLNADRPRFAGDSSSNNGTDIITIPGTTTQILDSAVIFAEPKDVIDATVALNLILTSDISVGTAVSVPLTNGAARKIEFITTMNVTY